MNHHDIVWQFRVRPERVGDFERAYGPGGAWARLFARSPDYLGTELLRDGADAGCYLTVDRWASAAAFAAFEIPHAEAYQALDAACAPLCAEEQCVGRFDVIGHEEGHRPGGWRNEIGRPLLQEPDSAKGVDDTDWLEDLLDDVAGCAEPDSLMGPLGLHYRVEEDFWEVWIYPKPVELVGGAHDGKIVAPGFSLDLEQLRAAFDSVVAFGWNALGLNNSEGPHIYVEGVFQGRDVYLQVLASAPEDAEPGLKFDAARRPRQPD